MKNLCFYSTWIMIFTYYDIFGIIFPVLTKVNCEPKVNYYWEKKMTNIITTKFLFYEETLKIIHYVCIVIYVLMTNLRG